MDDLIDGAEIEVPCDCGQVVKATVGELRRSPTLTCPQGHSIAVDGSQFDRDLQPVDREIKRLKDTLDNFGK
jgi:hypothetical protein